MNMGCILLAAAVLSGPQDERGAAKTPRGTLVVRGCLLEAIDDVLVPAQEAGVIVALRVKEGMQVEANDPEPLARIDDSKARMAKVIAEAEKKVADKKAKSEVNVEYAKAAERVARKVVEAFELANEKSPGSKPQVEIERVKLDHERTQWQIRQAELDREVEELTAEAKQAQVDAAEEDIHRRRIVSPIDGEVVEVRPQLGEWVNAGDTVLRIVRLDQLRAIGRVNVAEVAPYELHDRPVRLIVDLERGRREEFQGRVVWIDPQVAANGEYRFWVEVDNRLEVSGDFWILRPGLMGTLVVDAKLADRPTRRKS
jgi:multidrug efflux pump subunit AcrA (membrane-fusion protein)